jgi:hypothetical protein
MSAGTQCPYWAHDKTISDLEKNLEEAIARTMTAVSLYAVRPEWARLDAERRAAARRKAEGID